jgi:hypothetical protein
MRSVTMTVSMSGGGPGGRDWRDYPAGASLDVADWEAEDLIRIGLAVAGPDRAEPEEPAAPEVAAPAEAPAAESEPGAGAAAEETGGAESMEDGTGVSPLAQVSPLAETAGTAAGVTEAKPEPPPPAPEPPPAPAPEPEQLPTQAPVLRPMPSDVKQLWIDYAVSQGEDREQAHSMTKADLMSKYGGRL